MVDFSIFIFLNEPFNLCFDFLILPILRTSQFCNYWWSLDWINNYGKSSILVCIQNGRLAGWFSENGNL